MSRVLLVNFGNNIVKAGAVVLAIVALFGAYQAAHSIYYTFKDQQIDRIEDRIYYHDIRLSEYSVVKPEDQNEIHNGRVAEHMTRIDINCEILRDQGLTYYLCEKY